MRRTDSASDRLRRRVAAYVREHDILRPGERVLLLLSGGADSMALLALLPDVDEQLGLGLRYGALHVDYAMRGADSERDRRIVAEACATARVPLHEVRLPRKLQGGAFQARARALRYERARDLAASEGYDVAVTAHNRDDQAETVLYRLAKYATPGDLAGMRPRDALVARPLLCLAAAEIRAYCRACGITFGEDVTNAQPVYARNRIRLDVLPKLAGINPRVSETIAAGAELAAAQDEALRQLVLAATARVSVPPRPGERAAVDVARLAAELPAVRSLVLHGLVRGLLGGEALVERRTVAALLRLAARPDETGRAVLRGGLEAVRGGGLLRLRRRPPAHRCAKAALDLQTIAAAGREGVALDWCGRRLALRVEPSPAPGLPATCPAEAFAALPPGARAVTLRHPRRGDTFAPSGLASETTVARFLAAARVAPAARPLTLVVEVDGVIAWVGYKRGEDVPWGRVAESFLVHESTASTLHVFEEGT